MLSDAPSIGTRGLSPRAAVALLTLQLRGSLQEAAAAEAAEAEADHDAAREELRARLEPLMDERRRALDAELAKARAEAAAAVAAARRAASAIVASASSIAEVTAPVVRIDTPTEPTGVPLGQVVVPLAERPAPVMAVVPASVPVRHPDLPAPRGAAVIGGPMQPDLPSLGQPGPITVVIDADAFARVFATVMATVLDERFAAWGAGVPNGPGFALQPVAAPAKPSFWSQARHLDVFLMGLAMAVVLVVLAAWLV
jgi:hypothetical protein